MALRMTYTSNDPLLGTPGAALSAGTKVKVELAPGGGEAAARFILQGDGSYKLSYKGSGWYTNGAITKTNTEDKLATMRIVWPDGPKLYKIPMRGHDDFLYWVFERNGPLRTVRQDMSVNAYVRIFSLAIDEYAKVTFRVAWWPSRNAAVRAEENTFMRARPFKIQDYVMENFDHAGANPKTQLYTWLKTQDDFLTATDAVE